KFCSFRLRNSLVQANAQTWQSIESAIEKDVLRTDRQHPFYESTENLETLQYNKSILMFASWRCMSDLLAPLLTIIQEESCAFWCFAGLMQGTVYINAARNRNNMERNVEYLRGLLRVTYGEFYEYLEAFGGDSLQLLFVHRWILLCFKREFPEEDVLRIWETCWTNYGTLYFHIFVALAIITVYGKEPLRQRMTHDEILLYFSSLSMHMNVDVVLKKVSGLFLS
ncbi:unnamed protein product, partial [Soboliphyme baturini]|uniref:Rab-GAP TBC domain-containing protein n=1 Tax=Soboliphyme baturini TaxID=241478 RepID=A0A183IXP9_9BILA